MPERSLAMLLASYAKFDTVTLAIAGLALGMVVVGWFMRPARDVARSVSTRNIFIIFCIVLWLFVLAGSAYLLIIGGTK